MTPISEHRPPPAGGASADGGGIWLALSGGGFRAALFNFGCLKRLHEIDCLRHVYAVSATSGGAYVAALLAAHGKTVAGIDGLRLRVTAWEEFEDEFLGIVRGGVLQCTSLLLTAYLSYGLAAVAFAVWQLRRSARIGLENQRLSYLLSMELDFGLLGFGPTLTPAPPGPEPAVVLLSLALLLHACLAVALWRLSRPSAGWEARAEALGVDLDDDSRFRFLRALVWPSETRWQELNLRFRRRIFSELSESGRLYLTGVDLGSGAETVFSPTVAAELSKRNAQRLWSGETTPFRGVAVAKGVAASSAFPPLFRPVGVNVTGRGPAFFMDGGVIDNSALNVPRLFSLYVRQTGNDDEPHGLAAPQSSFAARTGWVLGVDGGAPIPRKRRRRWGRLSTLWRLLTVVQSSKQEQDSLLTAESLEEELGIPADIVTLKAGVPPQSELFDVEDEERFERCLRTVRTNIDGFSVEECKVLTLLGYQWANEAAVNRGLGNTTVKMKTMRDILPGLGGVAPSRNELIQHLRYSKRRFALTRWAGRKLGV